MKPLCLFLVLFVAIFTLADEKYLVTRQPNSSTQVGEVITVPPNAYFIADGNGKLRPRLPLPQDIAGVWGNGSIVVNFNQLQAALADSSVKRVVLGANITVTANVSVPVGKTVAFNGYMWREFTDQTVSFYGTAEAGRYQIFQNWEAGDIKGTFGTNVVFPEWWGLVGTTSADGQHDLAINSAARSFGTHGVTVSLAAGDYYVSRPLDFRATSSRLEGAGTGKTKLYTTVNWTPPTWENCTFFASALTEGQTAFSAVSSADAGAHITVTTSSGGTQEMLVGRFVRLSECSVAAYNGTYEVLSISAHNTVKLDCAYISNSTGTALPVTLDSEMESGDSSASSVIWLGSTASGGGTDFFGGVTGVDIFMWYAVRKWPLKRIHGISWTGWLEEITPIKDISISNFSGFGIGGQHPDSIGTTNGVTVDGFWITQATRRHAVALYAGTHAAVHSFRNGTLDLGCIKSQTWAADTPPDYELTWPQFGILAAGSHTTIENVHIEGCGNAIHVFSWDGPGSVDIANVDVNHLMDHKMVYYNDYDNREEGPPVLATQQSEDDLSGTNPYLFHYASIVTIGKLPGLSGARLGYNSQVSVRNLFSHGQCKYLIRDAYYGIDLDTFRGRTPLQENAGVVVYNRASPYGLPTGSYPSLVTGAEYNPLSPSVDKTYFSLIY